MTSRLSFQSGILHDQVKEALTGTPRKKICDVVGRLDSNRGDDIRFLAESLATSEELTARRDGKSKLSSITCVRIESSFSNDRPLRRP
jgi:hypothetical protein